MSISCLLILFTKHVQSSYAVLGTGLDTLQDEHIWWML